MTGLRSKLIITSIKCAAGVRLNCCLFGFLETMQFRGRQTCRRRDSWSGKTYRQQTSAHVAPQMMQSGNGARSLKCVTWCFLRARGGRERRSIRCRQQNVMMPLFGAIKAIWNMAENNVCMYKLHLIGGVLDIVFQ